MTKLEKEKLIFKMLMLFASMKDKKFVAVVNKDPDIFTNVVNDVITDLQKMLEDSYDVIKYVDYKLGNAVLDAYNRLDEYVFDIYDTNSTMHHMDLIFNFALKCVVKVDHTLNNPVVTIELHAEEL
jgi:hypothetical protein